MPTLDYYWFEHEDAINGFVAEYDGQPGNRYVGRALGCGLVVLGSRVATAPAGAPGVHQTLHF
jgi:hypothetical protein